MNMVTASEFPLRSALAKPLLHPDTDRLGMGMGECPFVRYSTVNWYMIKRSDTSGSRVAQARRPKGEDQSQVASSVQACLDVIDNAEPEAPPRERMLKVAKSLFASKGYEQTRTSEIARIAQTSESQLVKHFGGKQGLLEDIFENGWRNIIAESHRALEKCTTISDKLRAITLTVTRTFDADRAWMTLVLLEGRRMRNERSGLILARGLMKFVELVDSVLAEAQRTGSLRSGLNPQMVRSALMGMIEGMARDRLLAQTISYPARYGAREIMRGLDLLLTSFFVPSGADARTERHSAPEQNHTI